MRRLSILAIFVAILVTAAMAGDEQPWFDLKNCAFCKNLTIDPQLMNHMKWEHYNISNGSITITQVEPQYQESYLKAQQAMQKVAEDLAQGKSVKLCGHCQAYGGLMMAGAKVEYVKSSVGDLELMTSNDPDLIKKIHAFTDRNQEELAKMEAEHAASK